MEKLFRKAVEKFQAGQHKPAEKLLLKINKRQAGIPDVLNMLAYIALETDRPKTAVKYLLQVIKSIPDDAGLFNLLGCAHHKDGKVDNAIEAFTRALILAPALADARFNLANALQEAGRLEEAAEEYRRMLELKPNDASVHKELGGVLHGLNSLDQALTHLERAIALQPGYTGALNTLGLVYWDRSEREAAMKAFSAALESDPGDAESLCNMGASLAAFERLEEAEKHLSRALEINSGMLKAIIFLADVTCRMGKPDIALSIILKAPARVSDSHDLHRVLGIIFQDLGQNEKALASLAEARRLQPENADILYALSSLLEKSSKLEDALEVVNEGLKAYPDDFGLNLTAARIAYRKGEFEKALGLLLSMTVDDETPSILRQERFFDLGRVYDRLEDADKAFEFYRLGNDASAQSWQAQQTDKKVMVDYIDRHLDVVTGSWIATWSPSFDEKGQDASPVFLIGFPRSGTTLLDQILDAHPNIQVMEEQPTIEKVRISLVEKGIDYPDQLATLTQDEMTRLRQLYFEIADQALKRQAGSLLVDKMPLNTVEVALIHRLFPNAKIILSLRHPSDVCLSCFMQSFALNAGMSNFLTLEGAANLYERVMTLWRRYESQLELSVFRMRYEDLIDDLEGSARELLEFLELPWDDAVLNYHHHAATRNIITPSYSQVTQKIYTRARYRWLRYEKYMDPMISRLQPFIDEFGYGESG
jgi:tetratricopeptide (TPR) repeat protein